MKAIICERPVPVCILNSCDPARAHRPIPLSETFARNTPPIQHKVGDDYDDCERSAHLDFIGDFK